MPAPLLLVAYNRPRHLRTTLETLARTHGAGELEVVAHSDGPRDAADEPRVDAVRALLRAEWGFRSLRVLARESNLGLAASVMGGVGEVLAESEAVMVFEDDLRVGVSAPAFLDAALRACVNDERVFSVSAYVPPVPGGVPGTGGAWLAPRPLSTGWAVWRDRWATVDWGVSDYKVFAADASARAAFARGGADLPVALDAWHAGVLDSWAIRFAYAHFRQGRFALLPRRRLLNQGGFDGSGRNCRANPLRWFEGSAAREPEPRIPGRPEEDPVAAERLRRFFDTQYRLACLAGRLCPGRRSPARRAGNSGVMGGA